MGSPERRHRERDRTRAKILGTARKLFARHGYQAVTMRGIARQIQYTPTAIYFHFKDKESLLRELSRADFAALATHLHRIGQVADLIERIRRMGLAYVEFGVKYPHHYRLQFMTPSVASPLKRAGIEKGNPDQDAFAFLQEAVSEAMGEGRFQPEWQDAELLAQTFWAGVHGVVSLSISKPKDAWIAWRPVKKRAEMMVEALLQGALRKS
jgi:AcrR family transcriptional regulator